jgi:hypothetical protein
VSCHLEIEETEERTLADVKFHKRDSVAQKGERGRQTAIQAAFLTYGNLC